MAERLTCPVCGYLFETGLEGACGACPLHSGCAMACCPACGHSTIDPGKSRWVRWFEKWFDRHRSGLPTPNPQALKIHVRSDDVGFLAPEDIPDRNPPDAASLATASPGEKIRVVQFADGLSLQHRLRLQAFGVEPGHMLEVIQQHPVTIVLVDHTELAVERMLAQKILVQA